MKQMLFLSVALLAAWLQAAPATVLVEREGAGKIAVSVSVKGDQTFATCLKRNLAISGAFQLVAKDAAIKVEGEAGGRVAATGMGKVLPLPTTSAGGKDARMEARRLADKMCEVYAKTPGFACDQIAFVKRCGGSVSELCTGYPDGSDIRQLTADGGNVVGPRWKDRDTVFYTGIGRNRGPEVFECNVDSARHASKWRFGGLATGAAVSPDGTKAAIVLSVNNNPELYVIDMVAGTFVRLTTTPFANEGQPAWSPDGRSIVYVSDETRHQHLHVIDIATKKSRRITSKGSRNVDPDWGADGRIVYVTRRSGGNQIAVISPAEGDRAEQLVGEPGDWEHPSWARDARHVAAESGGALWIVDTAAQDPDRPARMFQAAGKWINPSWSRR